MNAAERLKMEIVSVKKEDFIQKVTESIRRQGYYSLCVDARRPKSSIESGFYTLTDIGVVLDWARFEGFRVERETTYYGQNAYFISL